MKKSDRLIKQVRSAIATLNDRDAVFRAAAQLIDSYSDTFNWTGFYLLKGKELSVGPYVGQRTPHETIPLDQGICGAAATQHESVIVDDVTSDPRYLACSVETRSEIVVPLMDGDKCLGEIDIDSNKVAAFSNEDKDMLEKIAQIIVDRLRDIA